MQLTNLITPRNCVLAMHSTFRQPKIQLCAVVHMCSVSNRWSSTGSAPESRSKGATTKAIGRPHSTVGKSACRIPRQCFQRNSQELERETPMRAPSQSSRRQNDLERDMSHVEHSLQAMAAFVISVESKPGNAEALQSHLRRSLPPRLPQRQTSVRRASVL
jgi:hypothetical protein